MNTLKAVSLAMLLAGCGFPDVAVYVKDGTCRMEHRWTGSTQLITRRLQNGGVECTVRWEPLK